MFGKDFNTLLNKNLLAYKNYTGKEPSSEVIVRATMMTACEWGLYNQLDYIVDEFFPHTCSREKLEIWASILKLTVYTDESDSSLRERILNRFRKPPAGGNRNDFEQWAKECRIEDITYRYVEPDEVNENAHADVASAYCIPLAQGPGSVDVIVVLSPFVRILEFDEGSYTACAPSDLGKVVRDGNTGDEGVLLEYWDAARTWWVRCTSITKFSVPPDVTVVDGTGVGSSIVNVPHTDVPYPKLLIAVKNYLDQVVPVCLKMLRVLGVTIKWQSVTIQTTGPCDTEAAAAEISAYMKSLIPGQTLYRSQLLAICIANGATNAAFPAPETPSADVTAAATEVIRPNVVTIS